MAFDVIGVGTLNQGDGDTLRNGGVKINANFAKAVEGPASSVDDRLALFSGTSGKVVKQAAFDVDDVARLSTAQTITGAKTFTDSMRLENTDARNFTLARAGATVASQRFRFEKSRGTIAAPTIISNNDRLGRILFSGYDGADFVDAAQIEVIVDGSPGSSGDIPSRITFSTKPGAGSLAERMRIAADGTVQLPSGSLGIKFGTRNANLDDYEEGTWTTTFSALTNLTGTAVLDGPHYTKIGRVVHIAAEITGLSVTSSDTQTFIVLTLPAGFGTLANTTKLTGICRLSQGNAVGFVANNTGSNNTEIALVFRAGAVPSTGSTTIQFSLTYIS
jgi:hypothetical protein